MSDATQPEDSSAEVDPKNLAHYIDFGVERLAGSLISLHTTILAQSGSMAVLNREYAQEQTFLLNWCEFMSRGHQIVSKEPNNNIINIVADDENDNLELD